MSTALQADKDLRQDRHALLFILDLRDPFSYLALGPAIELATQADSADWLPVRRHTLLPPSPPSMEDDRGIQHRRARAQMIAREIAIYAERQDITVGSPYRDGHADAAYTAWLWVRATAPDRLPTFLKAVFEAYWAEDLDPEEQGEIFRLVERLDLDGSQYREWASSQGATRLRTVESLLQEAGISQSPAYLVEDEIFYGRQHLPMIRWILEGRQGAGPI